MASTTTSRRVSEPHDHHRHAQPKYAEPNLRYRRHTEANSLHKVHSRPEDYKNKPRPANMVEYICTDGNKMPVPCEESRQQSSNATAPTSRSRPRPRQNPAPQRRITDSGDESDTVSESSYDGDDSEDDLMIPQKQSGRQQRRHSHEYRREPERRDSWSTDKRRSSSSRPDDDGRPSHHHREHVHEPPKSQYLRPPPQNEYASPDSGRRNSWHASSRDEDQLETHPMHRHNTYNHTDSAYDSRSNENGRDQRPCNKTSSVNPKAEMAAKLISEVVGHIQSQHGTHSGKGGSGGGLMNEILGEVMKKVADGTINGDMMKEVLREVQHVL